MRTAVFFIFCATLIFTQVLRPESANALERKNCYKLTQYAADENIEAIRFCVSNGVDVNVHGERNMTALHKASQNGYMEIAALLLDNGADVNARSSDGYTPLHLACEYAHKETVELLISKGAGIEETTYEESDNYYASKVSSISLAAMGGDVDIMKILITSGADVNEKNTYGMTPLHFAAMQGHNDVVQLLISSGSEINAADESGLTPLGYAAIDGNRDLEKLLIGDGAELYSATDYYGYYALHSAAFSNDVQSLKQLIADGADVNMEMVDGKSDPLYELIMEDVISGQDRHTPLHEAAVFGHKEIAELLIASGGNVDAVAEGGITPLSVAASRGYADVVELLITSGADVAIEMEDGSTPLHLASLHGYKGIVELLIAAGADVNAVFDWVVSPLFVAIVMGHKEVAEILIDNGAALIRCDGLKLYVKKDEIESLQGIGLGYILADLDSYDTCKIE